MPRTNRSGPMRCIAPRDLRNKIKFARTKKALCSRIAEGFRPLYLSLWDATEGICSSVAEALAGQGLVAGRKDGYHNLVRGSRHGQAVERPLH
jgi:hypothetical protein